MSHQSRRLNTSYRRNGKLQSCEPCRKGKLRCDHMMPTCGRCSRRNKPDQCVYHPAPLTKSSNTLPTPQSTNPSEGSPPVQTGEIANSPGIANSVLASTLLFPPVDEQLQAQPPVQPARAQRASSLPAQPWLPLNYCNPTVDDLRRPLPDNRLTGDTTSFHEIASFVAHTSILTENESQLGILPPNSASMPRLKPLNFHIDRGATLLTMLQDLPVLERYIAKWFSLSRGIIVLEPMVKVWTAGIWSTWRRTLEAQKSDGLRKMSEQIWENTLKPLSLTRHTTPKEFTTNTTGEHLRWEVVGIVMTLVGLLAQMLPDGDAIFCSHDEPPVNRTELALKAFNVAESCLLLCNDFDVINDLYLWLSYENTVMYCSLHAKGSYTNWRRSESLASVLVAYGLHQEIKVDEKTPLFIAEIRKRLFVSAYENDKYTSSFVGRPPRLTRQYCLLQMPLDLTDAQIMSDGLDLDNALAGLNDGWNERKAVTRCTFARVLAANALLMEETLEISIGVLADAEETFRRAAELESRAIQLWESYPRWLRVDPQNPWDRSRAPVEKLFLAYIRLSYLEHHFLLQRTLIKKFGAGSTKLLDVSREMFAFILVIINERDSMHDFQLDFSQLLNIFGIPSAAVIGVELLHQEQHPETTMNPLPRSDTIQDLSVFVACLGSVRPESGSYSFCVRGKKFIKRILDTILNPAPTAIQSSPSVELAGDNTSFTTPLFNTGNDGDFMRWLESMDWEQDMWMNWS